MLGRKIYFLLTSAFNVNVLDDETTTDNGVMIAVAESIVAAPFTTILFIAISTVTLATLSKMVVCAHVIDKSVKMINSFITDAKLFEKRPMNGSESLEEVS